MCFGTGCSFSQAKQGEVHSRSFSFRDPAHPLGCEVQRKYSSRNHFNSRSSSRRRDPLEQGKNRGRFTSSHAVQKERSKTEMLLVYEINTNNIFKNLHVKVRLEN